MSYYAFILLPNYDIVPLPFQVSVILHPSLGHYRPSPIISYLKKSINTVKKHLTVMNSDK
jgi:hypothetical protein